MLELCEIYYLFRLWIWWCFFKIKLRNQKYYNYDQIFLKCGSVFEFLVIEKKDTAYQIFVLNVLKNPELLNVMLLVLNLTFHFVRGNASALPLLVHWSFRKDTMECEMFRYLVLSNILLYFVESMVVGTKVFNHLASCSQNWLRCPYIDWKLLKCDWLWSLCIELKVIFEVIKIDDYGLHESLR